MKKMHTVIASMTILAMATFAIPVSAQTADVVASVSLPIEGRFARGGEFAGTATVNRFELRGASIVAVGMVTGTLRRGNRSVGSFVAGEVTWPVVVRVNGVIAARSAAPDRGRIVPADMVLAQAEPCPVVQVGLGAIDANLFGVDVALSPLALDLSGDAAAPLGMLVCSVGDLLANIAGLVDLLNSILGLLTGLLGGITGAIGGVVP